MKPIRRQSLVEQTTIHLREGFRSGRWIGHLPGVLSLSSELEVSKATLRDALHRLEAEGLVKDRGAGKRREIVCRRTRKSARRMLRGRHGGGRRGQGFVRVFACCEASRFASALRQPLTIDPN